MRRMPTFEECPLAVGRPGPFSHNVLGITVTHIHQIAEHAIDRALFKSLGNARQHAVVMEGVVAVEKANHIACCHCQTLVHGVVKACIGFGAPLHAFAAEVRIGRDAGELRGKAFNYIYCAVGARPVNYHQLHIWVSLLNDAPQRSGYCRGAVAGNGNDRNLYRGRFHGGRQMCAKCNNGAKVLIFSHIS